MLTREAIQRGPDLYKSAVVRVKNKRFQIWGWIWKQDTLVKTVNKNLL